MTDCQEKIRGSKRIFWGCLTLLLFVSACGPQTPPDTRAADESAIKDLDAQWSKSAGARDVEGTVAYYSDDASVLPPNAPVTTGMPAIRAVWASLLVPGVSLSWQPTKVEVSRASDLAYTMGVYQMTVERLPRQTRGGSRQVRGGVEKTGGRQMESCGGYF